MCILNTYPEELTNKQLYNLTMSPKTRKMSDAKGTILELAAFAAYEDTDKNGEVRQVLSVLTPEGEAYATNSPTFIADFNRMYDMFGGAGLTAIEIISGFSKAGREYITCAYAGE